MSVEKAISPEERIRRAEELYARRKNINSSYARVNVGESRPKTPIKKMIIQICICAVIYTSFYIIKNGEFIFTGQFVDQIKNVLEYDISFQNFTDKVLSYVNKINTEKAEIPEENKESEEEKNNKEEVKLTEGITEGANDTQAETLGIIDENTYIEEASSISQMQVDADYIKQNVSFIKPLSGNISSRFGVRHPTVSTVPTYHTGIDIAEKTGTKIIAAMEGEVTLVSTKGDYRQPYKNNQWRN